MIAEQPRSALLGAAERDATLASAVRTSHGSCARHGLQVTSGALTAQFDAPLHLALWPFDEPGAIAATAPTEAESVVAW